VGFCRASANGGFMIPRTTWIQLPIQLCAAMWCKFHCKEYISKTPVIEQTI